MQRIERYGVIALVFLLVTILAVSLWGEKEFPGDGHGDAVAGELLAGAPRPDAPMHRAGPAAYTTPVTATSARDRALPTSDHTQARNATPRERSRSLNPNVLDPIDEPDQSAGGAAPERRRRGRNALPTPSTAPRSVPSTTAPASGRSTESESRSRRPSDAVQAATEYAPRREQREQVTARAAAVTSMRTCVVASGETLSQIAQRELGTYKRWPEIAELNGGLDPAKVRKGMVLKLPERDSAQAARAIAAAMPVVNRAEQQPAPQPVAAQGERIYRVQKGDVLSVISQRELGTSKRWKEIVALNPEVDPERLIVGQKLILPGRAGQPVIDTRVAKADTSPAQRPSTAPRTGGWSGGNAGSKVR